MKRKENRTFKDYGKTKKKKKYHLSNGNTKKEKKKETDRAPWCPWRCWSPKPSGMAQLSLA